eukprot:TRINITY_DN33290_c0_g1_i1.p1 TRINITY_DN33290_c0_g1~~TRINITY_DN33290_c0_g1_i1.p1  ORF type:complete len:1022 (-),score=186.99 TRINITY_DN33290_c0_g1_i1:28-2814(-)
MERRLPVVASHESREHRRCPELVGFRRSDGCLRSPSPPGQQEETVSRLGSASRFRDLQLVRPVSAIRRSRPDTASTTRTRCSRASQRPKRQEFISSATRSLNFDQIFKISCTRAAKATASKRQCGKRPASRPASPHLKELIEARSVLKARSDNEDFLALNARAKRRTPLLVKTDQDVPSDEESSKAPPPEEVKPTLSRRSLRFVKRSWHGAAIFAAPPGVQEIEKCFNNEESDDSDGYSDDGFEEIADILSPPDQEIFLARLATGDFATNEEQQIEQSFVTHRYEKSEEVHEDSIPRILEECRYYGIPHGALKEMIKEVTPYSTLSLSELMSLMHKVAAYYRKVMKAQYDEYDKDGSGKIDLLELADVLKSMGIYPFRATVEEALAVVDEEASSELDFEKFVLLLANYRKTEGFSQQEVQRFYKVFSRFGEKSATSSHSRRCMRKSGIVQALLYYFGTQVSSLVSDIAQNARFNVQEEATVVDEEARTIDFPEFLRLARSLREAVISMYKDKFDLCDADGTEALDVDEIWDLLFALGYTPLKGVVHDLMDAFDVDKGGTLDFDEFVHMMQVFQKTDGFTRTEVQELKALYRKCGGTGHLDATQLSEVCAHLGHEADLDSTASMLRAVDWSNTGKLDFPEFLRFMRLHRENELDKLKRIFFGSPGAQKKEAHDVRQLKVSETSAAFVLQRMGIPQPTVEVVLKAFGPFCITGMDFDALVGMYDHCRKLFRTTMRKQAGFSETKIKELEKSFNDIDKDGNGTLEAMELGDLCAAYGMPLVVKADQAKLLKIIDDARVKALESGWTRAEVGEDGPTATFPVFIHFVQLLHQEKAHRKAASDAANSNALSKAELRQLKNSFDHVVKVRASHVDQLAGQTQTLDEEGLWDVFQALDVQLSAIQRTNVKMKLITLTNGSARIGFDDFSKLFACM